MTMLLTRFAAKFLFTALVFLPASITLSASPLGFRSARVDGIWKVLTCQGVKETSLGLGDDTGARVALENEEMQIVRGGDVLQVQVNQKEVARSLGKQFVLTDQFKIVSENPDGISGLHQSPNSPTVHTLIISNSGLNAVWSESSFSLGKAHNPFSTLVSFKCQVTQK